MLFLCLIRQENLNTSQVKNIQEFQICFYNVYQITLEFLVLVSGFLEYWVSSQTMCTIRIFVSKILSRLNIYLMFPTIYTFFFCIFVFNFAVVPIETIFYVDHFTVLVAANLGFRGLSTEFSI